MAKVSVIIPVYNVEKYLRECLDSVQRQTLNDLEIICIDDGSTDSSGEILDDYARNDKRFRIIHKANEGYGKTMNMGIRLSTAPYVGIVESDDIVSLNMYEFLFQLMEKKKADIIKVDFYEFYEDIEGRYIEEYVQLVPSENLQGLYGRMLNLRENKETFRSYLSTWSGLYNREFLLREKILYNETPGASYQDQGFWLQTMIKAKSIFFVKEAFYHYRIDNHNSSMYDKGKVFAVRDEYVYMRRILEEMGEAGKEFYPWLNQLKITSCLNCIGRVADQYKEMLAESIREDLLRAVQSEELDASLFDDRQKAELFSLLASPLKYVEMTIKKQKKLEKLLKDYDIVILYGAGKIGHIVQNALKEGRLNTKIKSFAVTNREKNPTIISGIPVKQIEKLTKYRKNALVIVCVGEKYISEVEEVLEKNGFGNWVVYKDLF